VGEGVTVHGTGFRPASLESGLFLEGAPRRLHCVTFAPTSQFSPIYTHATVHRYTTASTRLVGEAGFTVHGTGFRPASLESGLFLQGAPRRLHCVTFSPTRGVSWPRRGPFGRCVVTDGHTSVTTHLPKRPRLGHDTPRTPRAQHLGHTTHLLKGPHLGHDTPPEGATHRSRHTI